MKNFINKYFTLLFSVFLLFSMLIFPDTAIKGASRGLNLWWNKVLPALLPFFMLTEILPELKGYEKIVSGIAFLCRRLFRMNGAAGTAVILGFTSGFPTGATVCDKLLRRK